MMQNILVPIDFSSTAKGSLEYASKLSRSLKTNVIALNVTQEEKITEERSRKVRQFIKGYPNEIQYAYQQDKNIESQLKKGDIIDKIITTAMEEKVELIILGTRKKHSLKDYLMGSISTQLIRKTKIPILIIPEGCQYKNIDKITLATHNHLSEDISNMYLQNFAELTNAKVTQLYIQSLPRDFSANKEDTLITKKINQRTNEFSNIKVVRDSSIIGGIEYYIQKYQPDLLALYLPKLTKLQELFHRSFSKRMVYESKIPLLLISEL